MAPKKSQHGASAKPRGRDGSRPTRAAGSSPRHAPVSSRPRTSAGRKTAKPQHGVPFWRSASALALLVILAFAWAYYPVAKVQYRETREKERLEAELVALRQRNDRLRTEVAILNTPQGVEDYARSQLGMVKVGEQAGVVLESGEPISSDTTKTLLVDAEASSVQASDGSWVEFLDKFFGLR